MRGLILPFLVVVFPQLALASMQHGISVLAPEITGAAGLPPEAVGLIGGLSGFGSVWFFAASREILPVTGPVRALMVACFAAIAVAAMMASGVAALVLIAAPLAGFAYAVTAPAGSQILAEHTPRHLWGTLFSLRMAGVPAGGAIAGIAGGGLAALIAWRAGLAAVVTPSLLCALFLMLGARAFRAGEPGGRPRLRRILTPAVFRQPFQVLRTTPGLPVLTFTSLGYAGVQGSTFVFLTTYLTGQGMTLALAGSLFAVMQTASFAGRILVAAVSARVGSTRALLRLLGICSATSALLMTQAAPSLPVWLLFAGAIVIGLTVASWNGLFLSEVAQTAGEGAVGEVTAAAAFFTFIGYMATPPVFAGLAIWLGYRPAYLIAGTGVLTAALIIGRSAGPTGRGPGRA